VAEELCPRDDNLFAGAAIVSYGRRGVGSVREPMSRAPRLTPPVLRQLFGDHLGLSRAAQSARSERLVARTKTADKVVQSICPYCAVGCGQKVYVKDDKVIQIEGDPDSPISRGRLCPKGAASENLVNAPGRETRVRYRPPGGKDWEDLTLERATEMIAERVIRTRERTWEEETDDGQPLKRTLGIHFLGGATLDTEENYLIKKFFTAAGALSIENQARI
jgi:formate dehydrogenase major subunit